MPFSVWLKPVALEMKLNGCFGLQNVNRRLENIGMTFDQDPDQVNHEDESVNYYS